VSFYSSKPTLEFKIFLTLKNYLQTQTFYNTHISFQYQPLYSTSFRAQASFYFALPISPLEHRLCLYVIQQKEERIYGHFHFLSFLLLERTRTKSLLCQDTRHAKAAQLSLMLCWCWGEVFDSLCATRELANSLSLGLDVMALYAKRPIAITS
jgi:hypothetical protein